MTTETAAIWGLAFVKYIAGMKSLEDAESLCDAVAQCITNVDDRAVLGLASNEATSTPPLRSRFLEADTNNFCERQKAHPRKVIDVHELPHDLALSLLEPITNPLQIALNELEE